MQFHEFSNLFRRGNPKLITFKGDFVEVFDFYFENQNIYFTHRQFTRHFIHSKKEQKCISFLSLFWKKHLLLQNKRGLGE